MADLKKFWDELKHGDEVESGGGEIAYRDGKNLRWKINDSKVQADIIIHSDWILIKPKSTEIETEKWLRCDEDEDPCFYYRRPEGHRFCKSDIEDRKDFLYWDDEDLSWAAQWPIDRQVIWMDRNSDTWSEYFCKESGYTEQLVAGWAVMRKEG